MASLKRSGVVKPGKKFRAGRTLRAIGWLVFSMVVVARADDDATVERFLARLGLVDLQARHLERMVDTTPAGDQRRKLAERLADLYSAQLIERSENKSAYDQVMQRIQALVARVPESKTPALEVMLLQADYFRAETLMSKWMADRAEVAAQKEAALILATIAPQLDQRQQQLHETLDRLTTELDSATGADAQSEKLQEVNRVQSVAGRASFFAAWANYYLGLTEPAKDRAKTQFTKARDLFRRILGVGDNYTELEPAGLGLESVWRARTLIGLGLAEAAQGNVEGSRLCFDLLDRSLAPAELRELSPYWRLQALLNAGRLEEALGVAQPFVEGLSGAPSQGKVSFCIALVRAGFGGAGPSTPLGSKIGMLGITGLIKMRQQAAVRQLIEKYKIPTDASTGFHLAWLQGQQLLDAAEKSKRVEDYDAAAAALREALSAEDVRHDLAGASQCRYQLGWCLYKTGRLEEAATTDAAALDGLKATDPKTAAEAAWMQFICYQSLSKADRKHVTAAVNVLRQLQRDFPDHPYAKRAEYYAGKLQQAALPPEETISNLERVPPSAPDYLSARFDICQLRYDQWNQPGADKAGLATRVLDAVDRYLDAAGAEEDASRRARVLLIGIDIVLNGPDPDDRKAENLLNQLRGRVESLSSAMQAEYHYRAFQLATRRSDTAGRRSHADWIVRNAEGSPFELPALVVAAKAIDDEIGQSASASPDQLKEGQQTYRRLVARLGDDPATIQSKKNAQVALSRLAHFSAQLGEHAEALRDLEKLLAVFPTNSNYLRRAALSAYESGNHARAVEHWRKLVAGLPDGSEGWYEAKYYQLASLSQLDKAKAREALDQFRLLYPEMGPPAWRAKFRELQQRLE